MKRLLLPLLAALAIPTAANAESVWLVIERGPLSHGNMEKIQMANMSQCNEEGTKWYEKYKNHPAKFKNYTRFHCFKGK